MIKISDFKKIALGLCSFSLLLLSINCTKAPVTGGETAATYSLSLDFTRIDQAGPDPFTVKVHLKNNGEYTSDAVLQLNIPSGSVSAVTDNQDGTYEFTVTPATPGVYPVEVTYSNASVRRDALVTTNLGAGVGQPLAVPGNFVNTAGYEDGATVTPDGNYLFVQYGPVYFGGITQVTSICQSGSYSLYDLQNCSGSNDSNWVFDTIGPYNDTVRPNFPVGAINSGKLTHLNITVPAVANGIALFPTVFYGFKKQTDGTFAEPFKLAFNDAKGANGPFGLSFQMTSTTTAKYAVAWSNYFDNIGGDDKPNIYNGTITMGQDNSMGDVVYAGEPFQSITPDITPVSFSSHAGVQGNPHLYYDSAGVVKSIWTDDEQITHDLSVYNITSGTFPSGTWTNVTLPSKINTAAGESQPFFTGTRLYLNRDTRIVYHDYTGSGGNDYDQNSSWGDEVVVLQGSGGYTLGDLYGFGEPTIANVDGKNYLYFVYVLVRSAGVQPGRFDINTDIGFVEIP